MAAAGSPAVKKSLSGGPCFSNVEIGPKSVRENVRVLSVNLKQDSSRIVGYTTPAEFPVSFVELGKTSSLVEPAV